jgi:penicillin-binding protein 1C
MPQNPNSTPTPPARRSSQPNWKDSNQHLPEPVTQVDPDLTRVSPTAFTPPVVPPPPVHPRQPPTKQAYQASRAPHSPPVVIGPRRRYLDLGSGMGCFLRALFGGAFLVVLLGLCGLSILFLQYYRIAKTLPDINDLRQRASTFETTRIYDRNGDILYEILDPNAGRRTFVPLANISPYLVAATITTEDKGFYSHPGFDILAIFRAFWQNYQSGETVSGASTITQQLARTLLFSPEERVEQSYERKVREAILAAEITRRYSKDDILELYLNENYFGNLAYGVEAAAETYFNTTADKLTFGQAAFLAGLPQAPAIYDIYTNQQAVFHRLEDVLVLMYQASNEQRCIYVSNSVERVCVGPVQVTQAIDEIKAYPFQPPAGDIRYPHWVNYIRSLLESQYDPQTIYRSGFQVYTTLDPTLQDFAQQALSTQVKSMVSQHAFGGAVVVLRPGTGEILAMVGSPDFTNEKASGQVNMAVSPRQPGSAFKPLTYVAAFEKGWTPATLIWDVPSEFPPSGKPDDTRPPYIPVNYDSRFHGPVTLRYALANSYNIPAVKTLQFVGIYDDPATPNEDGIIAFTRRLGIQSLNRTDYGLSLTLGGGEVTLLELTSAFATFANQGRRVPPVAISRILDFTGKEVYRYDGPIGEQVVRPEHAFLISSILSDNEARTPAFGANSVLRLPFQAAVKTGTTNDFRDNWTVGYTPDVAVGVWVGNPDYTPMVNTSGVSGAAPVWAKVIQQAIQSLTGGNPSTFIRPAGVVEQVICEISGTLPSQWCPRQRSELFAADQPPLPKEKDLWQKVTIDTWTSLLASPACANFIDDKYVLNVTDEWARKWIRKQPDGQKWAAQMGFEQPILFTPSRECRPDDPRPQLVFLAPRDGETITFSPVGIYGMADATQGYDYLRLEFGIGEKPVEWQVLYQGREKFNQPSLIYNWNLDQVPPGLVTLRLYLHSTNDTYAETSIRLILQMPTPTPTPTDTPVPTQTPLPPPTETPVPLETPTPEPTSTPFAWPTISFPMP